MRAPLTKLVNNLNYKLLPTFNQTPSFTLWIKSFIQDISETCRGYNLYLKNAVQRYKYIPVKLWIAV